MPAGGSNKRKRGVRTTDDDTKSHTEADRQHNKRAKRQSSGSSLLAPFQGLVSICRRSIESLQPGGWTKPLQGLYQSIALLLGSGSKELGLPEWAYVPDLTFQVKLYMLYVSLIDDGPLAR